MMSDRYLIDLFGLLDLSLLENDYIESDVARTKVIPVKRSTRKRAKRISVAATAAVTAGLCVTILIKNIREKKSLMAG